MTIDRRSFSFAAIGLWLAGDAVAQDPAVQQAAIPEVLEGPSLTGRFEIRKEGKEAVLTLAVTPTRAIDVLSKRGSRPAPVVNAYLQTDAGEVELVEIVGPMDRREMMSRVGPRPTYVAVAQGQAFDLGPWRFQLAQGLTGTERVRVVAQVWTEEGGVELTASDLAFGDRANS